MKIGKIELSNPVFLSPMAGVTDLPFRLICKEMGCSLVYSEMISAKGILYNNQNTKEMLKIDKSERPIAIQLFGSDPKILGDIAEKLNDFENIDIIDINMGCPAPKIVKNGEGSALMREPAKVGEIVKSVVSKTSKPVTIKIRKGFDNNSVNALEIAKIAEYNGAAAVAVHGRTREQYYSGVADWNIIKEVKQGLNIPVIGNGDIDTPESAEKIIDETNCDAVMIGRAAQGNPWIFKQIVHYLNTHELLQVPNIEQKLEIIYKHAKMLINLKGEYMGIREMRKHLCWYTKGIVGSANLRKRLSIVESFDEMVLLLSELK